MKVPANISADKLILDYLARVTEAGLRYLPKGARIAFVGSTRARIERECGPAGLSDTTRVAEVLEGLGEAEDLVKQERARLDAAWVKRRATDKEAGAAAAAVITAPREHRPITSRWRPATDTRPLPHPPPATGGDYQPASMPPAPVEGRRRGLPGVAGKRGPADGSSQADQGSHPGGGLAGGTSPAGGTLRRPQGAALLGDAAAWAARGIARQASAAATLSRRRPLEATSIVLLGVGGLLYPFPFWLLGAVVAVMSRFFVPRDKWIALAGPAVIALLGTLVTALIVRGKGNPVEIYTHALRLDVGYLLRAGSVLCAGYLALLVRRGPRVRVPPWRR